MPTWSPGSVAEAHELYSGLGLKVIPLAPRGKAPTGGPGWNEARPEDWLRAPPDCNIGILTGAGFGVVDVDRPDLWGTLFDLGLEEIAQRTPVVQTSRGFHVWARAPQIASCRLPGSAGDLLGAGKQVVAPPSIHASGHHYAFLLGPPRRLALLQDLKPRFPAPAAEAPTQAPGAPAGCVAARWPIPRCSSDLERRARAWFARQSPRFRERVELHQNGRVPQGERSDVDFLIAKSLCEGSFSNHEVDAILGWISSKARDEGGRYIALTRENARTRVIRERKKALPWTRKE